MTNVLNPEMTLQRAPDLRLRLEGPGVTVTGSDGTAVHTGRHALGVLDQFTRPMRLSDALESLRSRVLGAQDWVEQTATIVQLYEGGMLRDPSVATPQIGVYPTGFDSAQIHVSMLNDRRRTSDFIRAIRATVRPTDVVLDLGTGTGVLATAAALAGARHVYAVEMGPIGRLAQRVFEANGVADRVTLVPGRSTEIELPERADVMVSEIIGNEPLGEQVLEIFRDARRRLLTPDARLIPNRLRILGIPVEAPPAEVAKRFFTPDAVADWRDWYGIDFAPLLEARALTEQPIFVRPKRVSGWKRLAEPAVLADLDLTRITDLAVDRAADALVTRAGAVNATLVCFEAELAPGIVHGTDRGEDVSDSSWHMPVQLRAVPLPVEEGDLLRMRYRYRVDADLGLVTLA